MNVSRRWCRTVSSAAIKGARSPKRARARLEDGEDVSPKAQYIAIHDARTRDAARDMRNGHRHRKCRSESATCACACMSEFEFEFVSVSASVSVCVESDTDSFITWATLAEHCDVSDDHVDSDFSDMRDLDDLKDSRSTSASVVADSE